MNRRSRVLPTCRGTFFLQILFFLLLATGLAHGEGIGVYFGTFDPIHTGHLIVAEQALARLGLEKLYILPNYVPIGKPGATPFSLRHEMIRLVTLRNPRFTILSEKEIAREFERNPEDYIPLLIDLIRRKEGPQKPFFHICGTDSFEKMEAMKKLPSFGENRTVVVMARKGYKLEMGPYAETLHKAGRLLLIDPAAPELSSTLIRKKLQAGETVGRDMVPPFVVRFVQRFGLYGARKPRIRVPAGYSGRSMHLGYRKNSLPAEDFLEVPHGDFPGFDNLLAPLTLDADAYLESKIPPEISDLIVAREMPVVIVGGLLRDADSLLESLGFSSGVLFSTESAERIRISYLLARRQGRMHIIVVDLFGTARLRHMALEFGHLMARNGIPLSNLRIWAYKRLDRMTRNLCNHSLERLRPGRNDMVFLGYKGAVNNVLSDLAVFLARNPGKRIADVTIADLDKVREELKESHVFRNRSMGTFTYPFWKYSLDAGCGQTISLTVFRNLYGDQTRVVLEELISKGFRDFAMFGNGGGLRNVEIGKVYAPVKATEGDRTIAYANRAAALFPQRGLVTVDSLLEETTGWLASVRAHDLVDVETFPAADAVQDEENARIFSGVLVSDIPGEKDLTKKDENSPDFLENKRRFILLALKEFLGNWPSRLSPRQAIKLVPQQ